RLSDGAKPGVPELRAGRELRAVLRAARRRIGAALPRVQVVRMLAGGGWHARVSVLASHPLVRAAHPRGHDLPELRHVGTTVRAPLPPRAATKRDRRHAL